MPNVSTCSSVEEKFSLFFCSISDALEICGEFFYHCYYDLIFFDIDSFIISNIILAFLRKVMCHQTVPCVICLLFGNQIQSTSSLLQCRSVSIDEISCLLLSGNYIAIALVDQDKLRSVLSLFLSRVFPLALLKILFLDKVHLCPPVLLLNVWYRSCIVFLLVFWFLQQVLVGGSDCRWSSQ